VNIPISASVARVRRALQPVTTHRLFPMGVEVVGWICVVMALWMIYSDFLSEHLENSLNPLLLNDDVRQQIPPFYRFFGGNTAFDHDYIYTYYYNALPIGYRALFTFAALLGEDPQRMSGWLPLVLHLGTAGCLMAAANHFGGKPAAFAAGCVWLGGGAFHQIVGGLPRSFAFPVVSLCMLGLTLGRPMIVAVAAVAGAGFYPMAGVLSGLCLAGWFVLPARLRGAASDWSPRRRLQFLVIAGVVSVLTLLPAMLGTSDYGGLVRGFDSIIFPEAGPGGRLNPYDHPPFRTFLGEMTVWVRRYLLILPIETALFEELHTRLGREKGEPMSAAIGALTGLAIAGWVVMLKHRPAAVRLTLLLVASYVAFVLAQPLLPKLYLPPRYPKFGLPLLAILIACVGGVGLIELRRHTQAARTVAATSVATFAVVLLGAAGNPLLGLKVDLTMQVPMLDFVSKLPEDVVIAGMPRSSIEDIPYYSRRAVLLTRETHQPFHRDFIIETRERMYALIDAYFATDEARIRELAERYGVTHMLIHRGHFVGRPPNYHAPFRGHILRARRGNKGRFILPKWARSKAIFTNGPEVLIELPYRAEAKAAAAARNAAMPAP